MHLLLADDHVLFSDALVQYFNVLKPHWKIDVASDLNDAHDMIHQHGPYNLVLLDLRMPGMHGIKGLVAIRNTFSMQKVAILSGVAEEHHVSEAMKQGARAYFPKTLPGKTLIRAIEKVVTSKQKYVPTDESGLRIMPAYFDDFSYLAQPVNAPSPDKAEILSILTKREKQVLYYLSQGLSNKEIGREMSIETATVKLYVNHLCKKLDVKNRTQAAITVYNHDLLPLITNG